MRGSETRGLRNLINRAQNTKIERRMLLILLNEVLPAQHTVSPCAFLDALMFLICNTSRERCQISITMSQQEALISAFTTLPDLRALLLPHLLRQIFLDAYIGRHFNFTSFFLPIFPHEYQAGGENSVKIPLG